MNTLRRIVLPLVVAGAALTASSVASAGQYVGRGTMPGQHQDRSVPATHTAVPTRHANSSATGSLSSATSHSSASSSHTAAAPGRVNVGNSRNAILPH